MLGERIKAARLELGLSQGELAGSELSRSLVSELERNKRRPSTDTIQVLAKRLGKPLTYFMLDEHEAIQDKAVLAINHAHNLVALGQIAEARTTLAPVTGWLAELPMPTKAHYHELQAWLEQAVKNTLSAINHALTAAELYAQLEQIKKEWYSLYVGASASYNASLYEQCIELASRALTTLAKQHELQQERRLTLNLLGSTYFSLGRIELADKCYEDALACPAENDANTLIRLYHGRSICAQQQGDLEASLRWSEVAAALSRKRLDEKLTLHNEINKGICLIRLKRIHEAMRLFTEHQTKLNLLPSMLELSLREYLLALAEVDPYPQGMCVQLEASLEGLIDGVSAQADYNNVKSRWALAKSRLRRQTGPSIQEVAQEFAAEFKALSHNRRAAEVLEYGALLLEASGDILGSHELLKAAVRLK